MTEMPAGCAVQLGSPIVIGAGANVDIRGDGIVLDGHGVTRHFTVNGGTLALTGNDLKALRKKTVKSIRKARGAKMAFKWLEAGTAGRKLFKHKRVGKLKVTSTFVDASTHARVQAVARFKLRH